MQIPSQLINSLIGLKGFHQESFELVHALREQITSIRLNPRKMANGEIENSKFKIQDSKEESAPNPDLPTGQAGARPLAPGSELLIHSRVPWSSQGYYLSERPSFTFDPLFHAGCYYVQEASSMFLEEALKQTVAVTNDIKVLDLCAAPGGKSTLIQSVITPKSLLVSNEVIKSRVAVLEENITKWGGANVIVTNNDPKDMARLENFFDVLVIDAPCSGSGLFRRDAEAIEEWSGQNVQLCTQRQQRIIADVWPCLKKGGVLIYSTCSYSKEEDEDIMDWIMNEFTPESLPLIIKPGWNITETISSAHSAYGYRFWPDKVKGEGFFLACFRKTDGGEFSQRSSKKSKIEFLNKPEEAIVKGWLKKEADVQLIKIGDSILALPDGMQQDLQAVMSTNLYIRQAGVRVGKMAGKDLLPDHALAVSNLVNDELVAVSLNHHQAIQYLRREEVGIAVGQAGLTDQPDTGARRGWVLVKYKGINIGWIKILQNRINNYYPKEWRILKK